MFDNNGAGSNNLKNSNGEIISVVTERILVEEAEKLRKCIQAGIDEYYRHYLPKIYMRTHKLKNALKAETKVNKENGKIYIGLYFEDSKAWGRSIITGEWNGYKPWLINDGWKVTEPIPFRNVRRFGYYEGFHFIEKGIDDWRSRTKYKNIEVRRTQAGMHDTAKQIGYSFE